MRSWCLIEAIETLSQYPCLTFTVMPFVLWDGVSLSNPGCPEICSVDYTGLEYIKCLPASAVSVLTLKVCTTHHTWYISLDFGNPQRQCFTILALFHQDNGQEKHSARTPFLGKFSSLGSGDPWKGTHYPVACLGGGAYLCTNVGRPIPPWVGLLPGQATLGHIRKLSKQQTSLRANQQAAKWGGGTRGGCSYKIINNICGTWINSAGQAKEDVGRLRPV